MPAHELDLGTEPTGVARARQAVRQVVADLARPELADDAQLLVSEVVTNALVHAGPPVRVRAEPVRGGLRVEVHDTSARGPVVRDYGGLAGTGRGLRLLDELAAWGVDVSESGKTVWFELGTAADEPGPGRPGADPSAESAAPDAGGEVVVTLLHVPLLLHTAWQMHAESFLREHLLMQLGEGDEAGAIESHAACTDALALLEQHIPAPVLDEDPEAIMAGAVGPATWASRVELRLPRSSVRSFAVLDATLDAALEVADSGGGFLTPAIQPELRALRRWFCASVREQVAGRGPRPWQLQSADLGGPRRRRADDGPGLEGRTDAALLADDENLILAVTPAASDLLGYAPGEMVGDRLICIIPSRFHQAHLAGFTMHLLAGRSALIGVPLTVPAVRKDGSELTVSLTVTRRSSPTGRVTFLAELHEMRA